MSGEHGGGGYQFQEILNRIIIQIYGFQENLTGPELLFTHCQLYDHKTSLERAPPSTPGRTRFKQPISPAPLKQASSSKGQPALFAGHPYHENRYSLQCYNSNC
ncbi:unnamed protein product [Allacma fusca]|uniref:Uncharacterized protein n=1 Tax=Allacma fusca TaxID=39272 RepID=A0A8J2LGY7_9HEXA|nr:unnamed protein product [Allacma fusca]